MAQQTVTALFDRYEDASAAVAKLEAGGVPHGNISLVGNNERQGGLAEASGPTDTSTAEHAKDGTGAGATLGTVVGGQPGCSPASASSRFRGSARCCRRVAGRDPDRRRRRRRSGWSRRSPHRGRDQRARCPCLRRRRAPGRNPRHGEGRRGPGSDGDGHPGAARIGGPRSEGRSMGQGWLDAARDVGRGPRRPVGCRPRGRTRVRAYPEAGGGI